MSSGIRALVIGHADFAAGIISAVEQITGNGFMLLPLSSASLPASGIEELIRSTLAEHAINIVFTDLPAGSATMAVRRLQRSNPELTLVAGANLALLLEFVQQHEEGDQLAAITALEKGKAAMIVFRGSNGR
jgi:PTS system N-acetylgalactosamine-specific IIA component